MPVILNVRHLDVDPVVLEGRLEVRELDLGKADELMRPREWMVYEIVAEKQEQGILVRGWLQLDFDCSCARCLAPFVMECRVGDWACLLAWEGEDAAVVQNDCVDLTPYMREDMVLALPQRPLCKSDCGGSPGAGQAAGQQPSDVGATGAVSSAWRELDKLGF